MTLVFLHYYCCMKVVKVLMIFIHKDAGRVGIFFWKKMFSWTLKLMTFYDFYEHFVSTLNYKVRIEQVDLVAT